MKLAQILSTLCYDPLAITPSAHASLFSLFQDHANMTGEEWAKREGTDWCGNAVELPQAEVEEGIMYIPIGGPIGRDLGKFEKGAGCVDVADVKAELARAASSYEVHAVILDVDSPGGMVQGTPELADVISDFEKPIYAFTAGQMCSAAYWVGGSANAVYATKSADIGSIGVYCYWLDQTARMEAQGLKANLVASGKYKGMGVPGVPVTAAQLQYLQERVDEQHRMFAEHLDRSRSIARLDMQGQVFKGPTALAKGLVDGIVSSIDDVRDMILG